VDAFLRAASRADANGGMFNLGGDRVINLKDLADLLVETNGGGEYVIRDYPPERKRIDIGDYYADDSLIRSRLGWAPCTSLRDGLARTLAFYREHLERYL
jgi:UDP-glucose 4-epimerase